MARPVKKKVEFNAESLKNILQGILSEAEETFVKATQQYNKNIKDVHDNTDIQMVGKINADYLKIRNDTTEKKMSVAKLIKDIIYKDAAASKDNSNNSGQTSDAVLSGEDKRELFKLIKGEADKKNIDLTLDNDKKDVAI